MMFIEILPNIDANIVPQMFSLLKGIGLRLEEIAESHAISY